MKLNDAINKIRNLRNKLSNLDMRKSNILEVQKIEFALTDMIRESLAVLLPFRIREINELKFTMEKA